MTTAVAAGTFSEARRVRLRQVLAIVMLGIGLVHFVAPGVFVPMVPAWLPSPYALVIVSGFFEMLGGLGLLVPKARRAASLGLVALYVAVYPANINMALHPEQWPGIAAWLLWARLPLQPVFIAWAWWVGKTRALE